MDRGIYQAVLEYEQSYHLENQIMHYDCRLILIRGIYYKITLSQPKKIFKKNINDAYFNSIYIAPPYTGSGQYQQCSASQIMDTKANDPLSTYHMVYNATYYLLWLLCLLGPLAILGLAIFLVVKHNRKKNQRWEEQNR